MTAKFSYISLRVARHFTPRWLAHFLLRRSLIIRPGYETRQPMERVGQYQRILEKFGRSLQDQRILDFGYGGNFALACGLLQAGAAQVTLLDKYAPPENYFNQPLLTKYPDYLTSENGQVRPRNEQIILLEDDLEQTAGQPDRTCYDIILSSSVYEHLDDVPGITRCLARLTRPDGCQIHFIDLRDHYFKFPFEMLTFSEKTWKAWLNPGSNLNRYRYQDYERVFSESFAKTQLDVQERDVEKFNQVRSRIDPRFLTGDASIDSITQLQVYVAEPIT